MSAPGRRPRSMCATLGIALVILVAAFAAARLLPLLVQAFRAAVAGLMARPALAVVVVLAGTAAALAFRKRRARGAPPRTPGPPN